MKSNVTNNVILSHWSKKGYLSFYVLTQMIAIVTKSRFDSTVNTLQALFSSSF